LYLIAGPVRDVALVQKFSNCGARSPEKALLVPGRVVVIMRDIYVERKRGPM
jgi:hypothetical protein